MPLRLSRVAADRGSVPRFSIPRSNKPLDNASSQGARTLTDALQKRSFDPDGRGELLSVGQTIYESFSVCYEARSTPAQPFNLHLLSHYLDKLESVYDEFVTGPSTRATGSTADCRRTPPLPRPRQLRSRSAARTFRAACCARLSARYMPRGWERLPRCPLGICPPHRIALRRPAGCSDLAGLS